MFVFLKKCHYTRKPRPKACRRGTVLTDLASSVHLPSQRGLSQGGPSCCGPSKGLWLKGRSVWKMRRKQRRGTRYTIRLPECGSCSGIQILFWFQSEFSGECDKVLCFAQNVLAAVWRTHFGGRARGRSPVRRRVRCSQGHNEGLNGGHNGLVGWMKREGMVSGAVQEIKLELCMFMWLPLEDERSQNSFQFSSVWVVELGG